MHVYYTERECVGEEGSRVKLGVSSNRRSGEKVAVHVLAVINMHCTDFFSAIPDQTESER